jgi:hypothetical protein
MDDDPLRKANDKVAATYYAAADHSDDTPLDFWEQIGKCAVTRP